MPRQIPVWSRSPWPAETIAWNAVRRLPATGNVRPACVAKWESAELLDAHGAGGPELCASGHFAAVFFTNIAAKCPLA